MVIFVSFTGRQMQRGRGAGARGHARGRPGRGGIQDTWHDEGWVPKEIPVNKCSFELNIISAFHSTAMLLVLCSAPPRPPPWWFGE